MDRTGREASPSDEKPGRPATLANGFKITQATLDSFGPRPQSMESILPRGFGEQPIVQSAPPSDYSSDFDNWDLQGKFRTVGVAGKEARGGAWGIATSVAGPDGTPAEINRIKNQLLYLNPELGTTSVQIGQRYYLPDADTPENLELAHQADKAYVAARERAEYDLLMSGGARGGTGAMGTTATIAPAPYDDVPRFLAISGARGLNGPRGADEIPSSGYGHVPAPQVTSNGGVIDYMLEKVEDFQKTPLGHALQGLPPEGFIIGGAKAGLMFAGRLGKTDGIFGNVGSAGSLAIGETPPLLTLSRQPGTVIRNALRDAEFAQAQDLASFRGGKFVGAPTDSFPGIDGWLDGVPTQLKIVTGNGEQAVLRNIVKGARNMSAQGYVGDIAVDATRTGVSIDGFAKFVTPNTPVGRILNEGSVNNVYVKFSDGWLNITQGTLVVPGR